MVGGRSGLLDDQDFDDAVDDDTENKDGLSEDRIPSTPPGHGRHFMTPGSGIMSPEKKNKLLDEIKRLNESYAADSRVKNFQDTLQGVLQEAALYGLKFPSGIDKELTLLQSAYRGIRKETVRGHIDKAIVALIDEDFTARFLDIMKNATSLEIRNWNAEFLEYVSDRLDIPNVPEPLVQAGIKNGKIYWRITKNDKPLYHRQNPADMKDEDKFHFNKENTWIMTWEEFRAFKDSGKRVGSVAITKERFTNEFPRHIDKKQKRFKEEAKKIAPLIWDELKSKGILNERNRLSHEWRAASDVILKLQVLQEAVPETGNRKHYYPAIAVTLNSIASNPQYRQEDNASPLNIAVTQHMPASFPHRLERTAKKWTDGAVVNHNPAGYKGYSPECWDVGLYGSLEAHRVDAGSGLDFDHIPSRDCLATKAKESLGELGAHTADNPGDVHGKKWWTITVPHTLHAQGEVTFKMKSAAPFSEIVEDYLEKLKKRPEDFSLTSEDYLKALGAFRYLYRCQTKKPEQVGGKSVIGRAQFVLLTQEERQKIDKLFLDKIKEYLNQVDNQQIEGQAAVDDMRLGVGKLNLEDDEGENPALDSQDPDVSSDPASGLGAGRRKFS